MSITSLKNSLRLGNPYPVIDPLSGSTEESNVKGQRNAWTEFVLYTLWRFDQSKLIEMLKTFRNDLHIHKWILDELAYKAWIELGTQNQQSHLESNSSSPTLARLCVSGVPEIVKNSLVLFILEEIQNLASQVDDKVQVLYFCCDPRNRFCNSTTAMLKTWLLQLVQQRPDLTEHVCRCLANHDNRFSYLDKPVTIWNEILSTLKAENAGMTYCIINGLDELDGHNLKTAVELLECQFPSEGCSGHGSKLRVFALAHGRVQFGKFADIDFPALEEYDTRNPRETVNMEMIRELRDRANKPNDMFYRETLEIVAAYRQPPRMEHLVWAFEESSQSLTQRIQLCHQFVELLADNRVFFISSDVYRASSNPTNRPDIHLKLAHKCLDVIAQEFAQISMGILEDFPHKWLPKISTNLLYAVLFWAEHINLSQHCSDELLDKIITTFSHKSMTIEKWWIVYLHEVCHITKDAILRRHHTTVLHLFTFFGLHKLLQHACDSQIWTRIRKYLGSRDSMKMCPLTLAITRNHNEIARILITAGAEIKFSHILWAAESNLELANLVFGLYKGKPPTHDQMTDLLERSVISGSEELVSCTIRFMETHCERDVFPWKETDAFAHAIEFGQDCFVKHLVKITDLESTGEELLDYAVESHGDIMLMTLISLPKMRSIIQKKRLTLLNALNRAIQWQCPLMVNALLTKINIDLEDHQGYTPFQVAARFPNLQIICQLLDHPSLHFSGRSIEEGVALNFLLHKDRDDIELPLVNLKQLLERGARMQYEHFGITALHVASETGRTEVVKLLLETMSKSEIKADINRQPSSLHRLEWDDTTALAIAATKGYIEIVKLLLIHGADMDIKDRKGKSSGQLAQENGHAEIAKLLDQVRKGGVAERMRLTRAEKEKTGRSAAENEPQKQENQGTGHGKNKSKRGTKKRKGKGKGKAEDADLETNL